MNYRFRLSSPVHKQTSFRLCVCTLVSLAGAMASAAPQTAARKPVYSAARAQARKTTLTKAREAAAAILPHYKIDAAGTLVPDLRAAAAIIYNPVTKEVLWEENSQEQRSIASITKVMTATVFLETNPNLFQMVTIGHSDTFQASTTHLHTGDVVTADDLLHLLLIASDNAAARALARISSYSADGSGTSAGFIQRMNEKAVELGLTSTHYTDPSGLLNDNVSSAFDMARLITNASGDDRISSVMRTPEYSFYTAKHRLVVFHSTNHLLGRPDVDVRAGKTGFITKAGYCLATLLRLPQSGQEVAVVVLGARSNAGRFGETQNLFNWLSTQATTIFAPKVQAAVQQ